MMKVYKEKGEILSFLAVDTSGNNANRGNYFSWAPAISGNPGSIYTGEISKKYMEKCVEVTRDEVRGLDDRWIFLFHMAEEYNVAKETAHGRDWLTLDYENILDPTTPQFVANSEFSGNLIGPRRDGLSTSIRRQDHHWFLVSWTERHSMVVSAENEDEVNNIWESKPWNVQAGYPKKTFCDVNEFDIESAPRREDLNDPAATPVYGKDKTRIRITIELSADSFTMSNDPIDRKGITQAIKTYLDAKLASFPLPPLMKADGLGSDVTVE